MRFCSSATYRVFFAISVFFVLPSLASAEVNLVKIPDSQTVYYLDGERTRHAFPNVSTFTSWFGNDFSKIVTVSREFLSSIPLGKNVTVRPGKWLVKIPSSPKVYAVEQGGVLRHIENEGIVEHFYGSDWGRRLIDIPEVFFGDYTTGKDIRSENDIPSNVLYSIAGNSTYYWKRDDALWPFSGRQAIYDNGFTLDDAIVSSRVYYSRTRPITGRNGNIVNVLSQQWTRNTDCENRRLKAAFIFVTRAAPTLEERETIEAIKKEFPDYFFWATDELANIDLSYPTFLVSEDQYLKYDKAEDKLLLDPAETAQVFYETNPDVFDFLFVFTNYSVLKHREQALFMPVTNRVQGTGNFVLEASEVYGSRGKLKAMIIMDSISGYDIKSTLGKSHAFNLMMHEVLHQWSGEAAFTDDNGRLSKALLRAEKDGKPDFQHWNFYVDFLSPLGGAGWQDNGNGTFTSLSSQVADSQRKKASQLDLYLMGLLPRQAVGPVHYIIPDARNGAGNTISGQKVRVSVDQIVDALGKWRCDI